MFDFLKKKISSWIKGDKGSSKSKPKKEKKAKKANKELKEDKKSVKDEKRNKTKSEKKIDAEVEEIIEQGEKKEERKDFEEEKEEKEGFFSKLIRKISTSKLTEEDFNEIFEEFEMTLLENNVALEAVDKIKENLGEKLIGQRVKKTEAEARVLQALKDSILSILIEPEDLIKKIQEKKGIFTIVFFGINGTGKTTSIAKIAHFLKEKNIKSVLAAADTFRAASIEQLKIHGDNLGTPVVHQQYGSDPASVAFDAKKYAEKHGIKVVLIDTAGRMYTKENLLKEMGKIIKVAEPDLKIFVGESITGNDAVEQAKKFNEAVGIDGIILSKADVDEKAGAILSVSQVTGKPIYFLGTGQEYKDLEVFSKKMVLKNLGLD